MDFVFFFSVSFSVSGYTLRILHTQFLGKALYKIILMSDSWAKLPTSLFVQLPGLISMSIAFIKILSFVSTWVVMRKSTRASSVSYISV